MYEAKVRLNVLEKATSGQMIVPRPIVREVCYLQLRMICELIALGCLVAHGDIEATKRPQVQKEYGADTITKLLGELHPNFFPVPIKQTLVESGETRTYQLDRIENGSLTKAELMRLNGICGDILHKGSLKKLLRRNMPFETKFTDVKGWTQKIIGLLDQHTIMMLSGNTIFISQMNGLSLNKDVHVALAKASIGDPAR